MGYEQWWTSLESLIAELRRKKLAIPSGVMANLRSAKTMINVYAADLSRVEAIPAIEDYLLNVESIIMPMAREKFGEDFAEGWLKKLQEGRKEKSPEAQTTSSRFIPGYPKDQHWIRILPSDNVLRKDVESLAGKAGLKWEMQEDGYIMVHGSEEKVKLFIKKMAEKCRGTRKN